MKQLKHGDIVVLKTGAMGVIQNVLYNVFGDSENAYEIGFIDNSTLIKRSKDFCLSI